MHRIFSTCFGKIDNRWHWLLSQTNEQLGRVHLERAGIQQLMKYFHDVSRNDQRVSASSKDTTITDNERWSTKNNKHSRNRGARINPCAHKLVPSPPLIEITQMFFVDLRKRICPHGYRSPKKGGKPGCMCIASDFANIATDLYAQDAIYALHIPIHPISRCSRRVRLYFLQRR